jgi:4-hydroxy-4-methyl-2-oxoglutarate aldolase
MSETSTLLPVHLEKLRRIDGCTLANTIEGFRLRLRNEGFADGSVHCRFPRQAPMVGYAATGRIRTSRPPMTGGWYYDHIEFWRYIATLPAPRVIVMEDVDERPGLGAFVGEIHAQIGRALGCVGYATNGAVRDLPAVEALGFQLFSGSLSVSHAFAHVLDFGGPVEIGGLTVRPGDLLHGDRHGLQTVPAEIVARLPQAARELQDQERELIDLCHAADFSLDKLDAMLRQSPRPTAPPAAAKPRRGREGRR